jgi:hypothetical protein
MDSFECYSWGTLRTLAAGLCSKSRRGAQYLVVAFKLLPQLIDFLSKARPQYDRADGFIDNRKARKQIPGF